MIAILEKKVKSSENTIDIEEKNIYVGHTAGFANPFEFYYRIAFRKCAGHFQYTNRYSMQSAFVHCMRIFVPMNRNLVSPSR